MLESNNSLLVRVGRINTVEIKNLWGHYNFKWELNDDVNILVGINGSGKTTVFRIIESIFNDPFDPDYDDGDYNDNDFRRKMKFRNYGTEVNIIFNNTDLIFGSKDVWGDRQHMYINNLPTTVRSITNINTFDVLNTSEENDKTILDDKLEKLIFKKHALGSFTFLDYRFRKMAGTRTKPDEFEKYQKKINNFYALINDHFKDSYKEIHEDESTNGIKFYHTKQDKDISIYDLSAGEKQLLIIFFTVFLQDEQPSVLLLDEPEISLHIRWQDKLINTLRALNPNCQLIIATHSPSIFGKGWGYKISRIEKLFNDQSNRPNE